MMMEGTVGRENTHQPYALELSCGMHCKGRFENGA